MKTLKYNILWLFLWQPIWMMAFAPQGVTERIKTIEKEFVLKAGGTAGVSHKYGNVEFINSNGSTLKYEVTIKVMTNSDKKAQETFDRINIDFDQSGNNVTAKTAQQNNDSGWWDSMWGNNSESFEVNYKVYVPENLNIYVSNKYGDAYLADRKTDVTASVKYGDIHLGNVGGKLDLTIAYTDNQTVLGRIAKLELEISYAELKAEHIGYGDITSKYSELDINTADKLKIRSKYDEYTIDTVGKIFNRGKYDDFEIDEMEEIDIKSKYSDLELGNIVYSAVFDLEYGDLEIESVSDRFQNLDLESRYTDVYLNISLPFTLDLESTYTDVRLPNNNREVVEKDEEGNDYNILAHFKNAANKSAKLVADMRYGSIRIKE